MQLICVFLIGFTFTCFFFLEYPLCRRCRVGARLQIFVSQLHMCFYNWFYSSIIGRFFCCLALCRCVSSHIRFFFYGGLSSHVLALLIFSCIVSCLSQVLIILNKLKCQSYSSEDARVVKYYLPKLVHFQGR
jgi:hypothetical protein